MNFLNNGHDYELYRAYLLVAGAMLGLFLVLTGLIINYMGLLSVVGSYFFLIPLCLYTGGILLYWWWVFLFKINQRIDKLKQQKSDEVPPVYKLTNWNILHQAMSAFGGNIDKTIKNTHFINRPFFLWCLGINLLFAWILYPLVNVYFTQTDISHSIFTYWVIGFLFGVLIMVAVTPVFFFISKQRSTFDFLIPLGLHCKPVSISPSNVNRYDQYAVSEPAVFEGERRGRRIQIKTTGESSSTIIHMQAPDFTVECYHNKLFASNKAPVEIKRYLKSLPENKRWMNILVDCSADGIRIHRKSEVDNMWLYDLWLAESIAQVICKLN